MPRPLDSLRAQLVLLIVVALTAAQAISLWLFVDERGLAVRAALGFEAAGRAANVARLIEEAPPDLHASILRAANSPLVRFDLSDRPAVSHNRHSDGGTVEARVRALLGDSFSRKIFIELHEVPGTFIPMPDMPPEMMRGAAPLAWRGAYAGAEEALNKRHQQGWVTERAADLDDCIKRIRDARAQKRAVSIAYHVH